MEVAMKFLSDIEIAQACEMKPITEIAASAGIDEAYLELYGRYKAKVDYRLLKESSRPDGKLILVTAINPTPAGEGKTTVTVGLADALRRIGKNAMVAPVSYTHLDVYKRQPWKGSNPPVSFAGREAVPRHWCPAGLENWRPSASRSAF